MSLWKFTWAAAALLSGNSLAAPFTVQLAATDPALKCGAKVLPTLSIANPPKGTKSIAVVFWDQLPHQLIGRLVNYDLPPTATALSGGKIGKNDVGQLGYTAACAKGKHDIYIDVYAVNVASLGLKAGLPLRRVHTVIHQHNLQETRAHLQLVNP